MSERGVFAVDRGIWEHYLLASDDQFSLREAWLWLLQALLAKLGLVPLQQREQQGIARLDPDIPADDYFEAVI